MNAPNASMAAQAVLNHPVYDLARRQAPPETRPMSDEASLRRPGSWLNLLGSLCREGFPDDGPVAGYWVHVVRRLSDEGPGSGPGFTLPVNLSAQRLPAPHREPLAFAHSLARSAAELQAETRAYWEAMDLREELGAAAPAAERPGARL